MTVSDERVAPTISTRRQEQGFVLLGALRGVFGFGSLARSALVKWNVILLFKNSISPYVTDSNRWEVYYEKICCSNVGTNEYIRLTGNLSL